MVCAKHRRFACSGRHGTIMARVHVNMEAWRSHDGLETRLSRLGLAKCLIAAGTVMMAVSLLSLGTIAYCIFTDQWLPAIFVLLARKELLNWLDKIAGIIDVKLDATKLGESQAAV